MDTTSTEPGARPIEPERLAEIAKRAGNVCRCDDEQCYAALVQLADKDVPDLIAENRQLREAIGRLWKLPLHPVGRAWMVANTDLTRALHGSPVLDQIAEETAARALPDVLAGLRERSATAREAEAV